MAYDIKTDLIARLNMEVKELPIKYLGVPLISTRLKHSDCEELKAKMLKKVQSWHAKFLSYAGRVQLIIAVLSSIQTYWCRIFVLPKKIMKEVDAIMRTFLWSGASMRRATAKVAWSDVCTPKAEGGLGIPNMVVANRAYMTKHVWNLAKKKDTLWVKSCHTCIIKEECCWDSKCNPFATCTWRKILMLRDMICPFIKMLWGMVIARLHGWTIGTNWAL